MTWHKTFQGDCIEIMNYKISSDSIDLVVTSPPYDGLRTYDNDKEWGRDVWESTIIELYRVMSEGGVVVWVVADATVNGSESGTSFRQALFAKEVGFSLHDTMIYQKDNPPPVGGSNRYYQSFEYMFVWSKGSPKTFNPLTRPRRNKWNDKRTHRIRTVTRNTDGTFPEKKLIPMTGDVKRENVWRYVVGGGNSVPYGVKHPAAFPIKMVRDHILSWSNEGDVVLDPFMGSGTTGMACIDTDRNYIGIDIVEEYVEYARQRFTQLGVTSLDYESQD